MSRFINLQFLFISIILLQTYHCLLIMTKVKCFPAGPIYYQTEVCELHKNDQNLPVFRMIFRYKDRPVVKCNLQFVIKVKSKRLAPFVFNKTFDVCEFMVNRKSNKVLETFSNLILPFTNMNHSCPYDHDIFFTDINPNVMNNYFSKLFPWPSGEYRLETTWIFDSESNVKVNVDFRNVVN